MERLYEVKEEKEKVILVAVSENKDTMTEESLEELEELVETAGAVTVGKMIQNREKAHNGTYIGKGKIQELREYVEMTGATGIVCDDELTPAQQKNLEESLFIKVMDRTLIILDIFAKRAHTSEGKIQVELAQLKYRSARLTGMGIAMSRLGGGIGTRGPGEKKLEIDRRLIKDRIAQLQREISDMENHRTVAREKRSKNPVPVISIVGYTNAGKSTILNSLTDAGVLEEDKLFATLDPTTRCFKLPSGQEVLLTDTVGFIRKLPHHLINAFRSTLEEAKYSDIILHVVDSSNPQRESHISTVYETLENLKVGNKPIVTFFNKIDKLDEESQEVLKDLKADYTCKGSIKTGKNIDELLGYFDKIVSDSSVYIEKVFSYSEANKIQLIRQFGNLLSEEYVEEGILVKANVPKEIEGRL